MAQATSGGEINPRLTENTCDEPEASLMPLEDYQHADLVSLETAIQGIATLFRNLPRDVWIAQNASKSPVDGLTSDESAAIHLYTMENKDRPLYSLLNQLLRDRDRRKLKPWFSYLKLFLTGLFKLPTCSAKVVWRGVKANIHSKYRRGEFYTWWSFSSCTLSLEVLEQEMYLGTTGERTLFSIECLNGKSIKAHSYYKTEDEILLMPGFYFEVVSKVGGGNGLHIIHLREVVPPFVLLEPPFDTQQAITPITSNIDTILDGIYEMNKNNDNVCKLFVVLPNSSYTWQSKNVFENRYVIHFVCECSTNEMHFVNYPDYTVPNPRVFFGIYGEYMKQFMIPLAQHLFNRPVVDRYHGTEFWNQFQSNLVKIKDVLTIAEREVMNVTKAYNTSALEKLLSPNWELTPLLCRSVTTDMAIRWVCRNHYPVDQLYLMRELESIGYVTVDINKSSLSFKDELDSASVSHVSGVLTQGLRLYQIDVSNLEKISAAILRQLTKTLARASFISLFYTNYNRAKLSHDDKSKIDTVLESCCQISASNTQIKYLSLYISSEKQPIKCDIINTLKMNLNLRSINFGVCSTEENIIQMLSLLQTNKVLTTFRLANQTLSPDCSSKLAALIRSSATLDNLTLLRNKVTVDGLSIIVDAICVNPVMKTLSLWNNELSEENVPVIIHLLQACPHLTSLDLSFNKITVLGARLIFEQLETNQTLLHFGIGSNNLSIKHAKQITKHTDRIMSIGELIKRMLQKNTILCSLNIGDTQVLGIDFEPFIEDLSKNRTLAHLSAGRNTNRFDFGDQSSDILLWTGSLITLNLSSSKFNEAVLLKLSKMLRNNDTLQYLDLYGCDIGVSGMNCVAQSLKINHVLTHINLRGNNLCPESAKVLSDIIRINSSIVSLDIGWNTIGDDGVKDIARALLDNHTLLYIKLSSNEITDIGGEAMLHALQSNNTILSLDITSSNKLCSNILIRLRSIRQNLSIK